MLAALLGRVALTGSDDFSIGRFKPPPKLTAFIFVDFEKHEFKITDFESERKQKKRQPSWLPLLTVGSFLLEILGKPN